MSDDPNSSPPRRTIRASYPFTADLLLAARKAQRDQLPQRAVRALMIVLGLGQFVLAAIARSNGRDPWPFVGVGAVLLALTAGRPWLEARAIRRQFATRPDRDEKVSWEFDDAGFVIRSALSTSSMHWETIVRAVEMPEAFLLYHGHVLYYLPKSAFDECDLDDFAALVRSKVARYERLPR